MLIQLQEAKSFKTLLELDVILCKRIHHINVSIVSDCGSDTSCIICIIYDHWLINPANSTARTRSSLHILLFGEPPRNDYCRYTHIYIRNFLLSRHPSHNLFKLCVKYFHCHKIWQYTCVSCHRHVLISNCLTWGILLEHDILLDMFKNISHRSLYHNII